MIIIDFFNLIFYQPIHNVLFFFSTFFRDFGLAIFFLTLFVRILLFPLNYHNLKFQEKILKIQKEIKEIDKNYKGEERAKKIVFLYQKEKINPLWGLFAFFIQFPVLIALYRVFLKGTKESFIKPTFLGLIDLSQKNFLLAFFAGLLQFLSSKNQGGFREMALQNQMNIFLTIFTFLVLTKLPSAISFYLIFNFLFIILEKKIFDAKKRAS